MEECGFDGVQSDYEICRNSEEPFLDLLRQTRAAFPRGKLLSVAAPMWLPHPLPTRAAPTFPARRDPAPSPQGRARGIGPLSQ